MAARPDVAPAPVAGSQHLAPPNGRASAAVRVHIGGQFRGQLNVLTIHLNGQAIAIDNTRHIQAGDRVSLFHLHPEQLKLLSTGRNVLAVEVSRHDVASLVIHLDLLQVED